MPYVGPRLPGPEDDDLSPFTAPGASILPRNWRPRPPPPPPPPDEQAPPPPTFSVLPPIETEAHNRYSRAAVVAAKPLHEINPVADFLTPRGKSPEEQAQSRAAAGATIVAPAAPETAQEKYIAEQRDKPGFFNPKELQGEMAGNATPITTGKVAGAAVSGALQQFEAAREKSKIPYVTPALEKAAEVTGKAGRLAAESGVIPGTSVLPAVLGQEKAGDVGEFLGKNAVPTTGVDIALTAAPYAGKGARIAREGLSSFAAAATRPAVEEAAPYVYRIAVRPGATELPAAEFAMSRADGSQVLKDAGGARLLEPGEHPLPGEEVYYHGSTEGAIKGALRPGLFMTPDAQAAQTYADTASNLQRILSKRSTPARQLLTSERGSIEIPGKPPAEPPEELSLAGEEPEITLGRERGEAVKGLSWQEITDRLNDRETYPEGSPQRKPLEREFDRRAQAAGWVSPFRDDPNAPPLSDAEMAGATGSTPERLSLAAQAPEEKPLPGQTGLFGETVDDAGKVQAPLQTPGKEFRGEQGGLQPGMFSREETGAKGQMGLEEALKPPTIEGAPAASPTAAPPSREGATPPTTGEAAAPATQPAGALPADVWERVGAQTDPNIRNSMLERIANAGRRATDADLQEVLGRLEEEKVGSNAWNVAWAVAKNPAAEPATAARALALREEWMAPGRLEAEAAPSIVPGVEAKPPTTEAKNLGMADATPAINTNRKVIKASDIEYRPDLFQTRDSDPGKAFAEARVRQLVKNWDDSLFTPPTVLENPENPGKYIASAGQHRTEAFRRVKGADANLEVNVAPHDIRDPAQLARAQLEADASNTTTKALNVREEIRNLQRAQMAGQDQGQIETLLGKSGSYVERLENIARVGPQAVDRVVTEPALGDYAAEAGRAMHVYGVSLEDANALLTRLATTTKSVRPTPTAFRDTLDKFGRSLADVHQPGLFMGQEVAGEHGQLLELINRHAEIQSGLRGEINALKRAQAGATKLAGQDPNAKAAADRLISLGDERVKALQAELNANEGDVARAIKGDFTPRETPASGSPIAAATTTEAASPPALPDAGPPPAGGLVPPPAGEPPPPRASRFPPGTEDPNLEWLIGAVEGAGSARPSLIDLRGRELSSRVGEAMQRLEREGIAPDQAFRQARTALRGQLAADLFDVGTPPEGGLTALHQRIVDAVKQGDVQFFTGSTASDALAKLAQGINIAPHEADALGQVFGPRLRFAIEDMGEIFKVQGRAEKALASRPMEIPQDVPLSPDVLAAALRKNFPGEDGNRLLVIAQRMLDSGRVRVTVTGPGKLGATFDPDEMDALGRAVERELGMQPSMRSGLSGPKSEFPPQELPPVQAAGEGIGETPRTSPELKRLETTGERAPEKPLPGQPNLYMGKTPEGPGLPEAAIAEQRAANEARRVESLRGVGPQGPIEPTPNQELPPGELGLTGEGTPNLTQGAAPAGPELSPEVRAEQEAASQRLINRLKATGRWDDVPESFNPEERAGLPPGAQTSKTVQEPTLPGDWKPGTPLWRSTARAVGDVAALLAGRTLQTGFDLSYPLRQAGTQIRRSEWWRAWDDMFKSLLSEDYAVAHDRALRDLPFVSSKLHLSPLPGAEVSYTQSEEALMSRLVNRVPILRQSGRAVVSFINDVRANTVNNFGRNLMRTGRFNQDELDTFANYVNRATGWGNLGDFETSVGALNQLFYSTRRNVAMVQAPAYMFNKYSSVRNEAIKDFLSFFAVGMSTLAVADLSGFAEVGLDPTSADFGKIKVGDTRLDIWGGYQQLARVIYNISAGEIKDPSAEAFAKPMGQFLRNKLAPGASLVYDVATGKNTLGQKLGSATPFGDAGGIGNEAYRRLTPLAWQGVIEGLKQDGIKGAAIGLTGIFGEGAQTYTSTKDARDRASQKQYGKDFDTLLPSQKDLVNKLPAVKDVVRPSPEVTQLHASTDALNRAQADVEEKFKAGTLPQKLGDEYHDLGQRRQQLSQDFQDFYASQIANYPKTDLNRVTEGYYGITKNDKDGNFDYDATQAARTDYLNALSDEPGKEGAPSDKAVMTDFLQFVEGRKSGLQQDRDKVITEKKAAGYYMPKADTGALDKMHPDLDVKGWYYGGGLADPSLTPALQTREAVDKALALVDSEGLKNRPVKLAGFDRPINQDANSIRAYADSRKLLESLENPPQSVLDRQRDVMSIANAEYDKPWAQLDDEHRQRVLSSAKEQRRLERPDIDAWLGWWGATSTALTREAWDRIQQLQKQYGGKPPKEGSKLHLAVGAY